MLSLHKVLQSSKAAIDLASIMVGVIIIGLIGGVIAATVFAVIPWSQDKAAKQQLDSIHTAENAFFGLSSDPGQNLVGDKKNSFANSVELASNSLLTSNANYCVVNTVDGKDYHAYVKSSSGKTFYALNSNKQAQETTMFPCITDVNGIVVADPTIDNGTTPVGTAPGAIVPPTDSTPTPAPDYGVPVGTVVYSNDFENETFGTLPTGWKKVLASGFQPSNPNILVKSVSAPRSVDRTQYINLYGGGSNKTKLIEATSVGNKDNLISPTVTLTPGKYSASGFTAKGQNASWSTWTMQVKKSPNVVVGSTSWSVTPQENSTVTAYKWETHGVDFIVTEEGTYFLNWTGDRAGETSTPVMIDDVKIVKTGTL